MARRSKAPLVAILVGVLLAGMAGAFALGAFRSGLTPAQRAALHAAAVRAAEQRLLKKERGDVSRAERFLTVKLPTHLGAVAPADPPSLFATPLPSHQVLGFAPYWEMSSLTSADYQDSTTLAYFSLELAPSGDGSLVESGPGWTDLHSAAFATFRTNAKAAGDRILLTVSTTSQSVVDALVAPGARSGARLVAQLQQLVATFGFDGVDIDIEGRGAADRPGFVRFMSDLSSLLRSSDPSGSIVLDTYPQSASSSSDFFDVKKLAPFADALFVMAYDMYDSTYASANSPIYSPTLGFSEIQTLIDYAKSVPADKIIVGLPLYGLDFTTRSAKLHAKVLTSFPEAVTYSAIVTVGRAALWDPASETPFTAFKEGKATHQTWFDDPISLALKTSLAAQFHVEGVGAFAFGEEGPNSEMLTALAGGGVPVKLPAPTGAANS